jgi:hypothetical protein
MQNLSTTIGINPWKAAAAAAKSRTVHTHALQSESGQPQPEAGPSTSQP